jgi:HAD superfamily hydrolase (TIGR01509 family)
MAVRAQRTVAAVVFDLDGVLVDSEMLWARAREQLARELGGEWPPGTAEAMIGMSSPEWSGYMHEVLEVPAPAPEIAAAVVERLVALYERDLPLLPGAREAVAALARDWPLGLASSANRPVIDLVLTRAGMAALFAATVSSEEVARGKPAPDVYLEAARRLHAEPTRCVAVEDSANGMRAAAAAGMLLIAIPNRAFPPEPDALALADAKLDSLRALTPGLVRGLT